MPRIVLQSASYTSRSLIASAQRCINLYSEINPVDASAPKTFYGTAGRKLWATLPGAGGVRLIYPASNNELYGVRGSVIYRYDGTLWDYLADLSTDTGPVYAADNGISAVFVDGTLTAPTVKFEDHSTGLMSGDGWLGADFVEFLNGVFVFNKPNSQIFYTTGAYDLTLDALDFASSESSPDNLVRLIRDHNELVLFGEKSTDVFGESGSSDFAFAAIVGATMEVGCAAKYSPCRMDNTVYWMGNDERGDAQVFKMAGYQPQRISTHAQEEEWRGYSTIADAQGYSYQQSGHSFYVLTFPTAGKTWAFDAATQDWAERAYRTPTNVLTRVRDNCHAFYQRKHLVGDWENGNIYELDPNTYTDNGAVIARVKSFQHMTADNYRQFFDSLTVDMQAGVGNSDERDPHIHLRWSDDGGYTWSTLVSRPMGRIGRFKDKPKFSRLGSGFDRVFELSTTAKAPVVVQGAFLMARRGA